MGAVRDIWLLLCQSTNLTLGLYFIHTDHLFTALNPFELEELSKVECPLNCVKISEVKEALQKMKSEKVMEGVVGGRRVNSEVKRMGLI